MVGMVGYGNSGSKTDGNYDGLPTGREAKCEIAGKKMDKNRKNAKPARREKIAFGQGECSNGDLLREFAAYGAKELGRDGMLSVDSPERFSPIGNFGGESKMSGHVWWK